MLLITSMIGPVAEFLGIIFLKQDVCIKSNDWEQTTTLTFRLKNTEIVRLKAHGNAGE